MRAAAAVVPSCLCLCIAAAAYAEPPKASENVAVKKALARQATVADLSRASEPGATQQAASPKLGGGGVVAATSDSLGRLLADRARATRHAGTSRSVEVETAGANGVERPAAGPRQLQRMHVARVMASLEPATRTCAGRGGASPATTLAIRLSVTPLGEVERARVIDRGGLGEEVAACVSAVLLGARFRGPGGAGASLVVPVQLPARLAQRTGPAMAALPASESDSPAEAPAPPPGPVAAQ